MKTLLRQGCILHANAQISSPQDVLIEDGIITNIASSIEDADAEIINCSGKYISPGLTSLHAHSPMHILRGLAEDVSINDWFNQQIWPYESKITEEDIYWGTRLCCAEMIDNGVTAFADHYFSPNVILKATQDAGVRIDLAVTAFGLDIDKEIEETLSLIEEEKGNPMVKIRFGPHSPYLVEPKALARMVEEAKKVNVGIHIHASETELQEVQSVEKYGKRHFEIISQAGGFTVPCIIAHGLWANENDFSLVGNDTFIAACTKTYLKLGAGKGHLWDNWKDKNLCIGTDGAASSNSVRPLEQAQYFALCGKWEEQADDFCIEDIWRMLMNGHNALSFGTGEIAENAPADLIIWDLNTPSTAPVYNPLTSILYSADSKNITHTMVAGNFLKKDGVLTQDIAPIMENASRCATALYQRGKGTANVTF